jgi:hypothetical protein
MLLQSTAPEAPLLPHHLPSLHLASFWQDFALCFCMPPLSAGRQLNADGLSSQNEPIVSSWLVSLCYNSSKAFEPIGHHVYQLLLPALSTLHIQTEGDAHFLLNICLKNQSMPMPTIIAVFTMCRSGTQDACKST